MPMLFSSWLKSTLDGEEGLQPGAALGVWGRAAGLLAPRERYQRQLTAQLVLQAQVLSTGRIRDSAIEPQQPCSQGKHACRTVNTATTIMTSTMFTRTRECIDWIAHDHIVRSTFARMHRL